MNSQDTNYIKTLYDKFNRSSNEYLTLWRENEALVAEIQRTKAKIEGLRELLRLDGVDMERVQKEWWMKNGEVTKCRKKMKVSHYLTNGRGGVAAFDLVDDGAA